MSSSLYLTLSQPTSSIILHHQFLPFPQPANKQMHPLKPSHDQATLWDTILCLPHHIFERGISQVSHHPVTSFSLPGFQCHHSARTFLSLLSDSSSMCYHSLVLLLLTFLHHQPLLISHALKFCSGLLWQNTFLAPSPPPLHSYLFSLSGHGEECRCSDCFCKRNYCPIKGVTPNPRLSLFLYMHFLPWQ